jgi:hypothetical protein
MKNIIWTSFLGLCLNASWAMEIKQDDALDERAVLLKSIEPLERNPYHFAELAKATMDLMGPELKTPQTNDQKTSDLAE